MMREVESITRARSASAAALPILAVPSRASEEDRAWAELWASPSAFGGSRRSSAGRPTVEGGELRAPHARSEADPHRRIVPRSHRPVTGADRAPRHVPVLLAEVRDVQTAALVYAASLMAVDRRQPVNRYYLRYLAARLQLSDELAKSLEQRYR